MKLQKAEKYKGEIFIDIRGEMLDDDDRENTRYKEPKTNQSFQSISPYENRGF